MDKNIYFLLELVSIRYRSWYLIMRKNGQGVFSRAHFLLLVYNFHELLVHTRVYLCAWLHVGLC